MRYKIGRNPVYRAPIPALIGGINTASSSDVVGDNQLSNCLNMMAMDGILRTRPGFVVKDDDSGSGINFLQSTAKNIKKYDFTVELERSYGIGNEVSGGIKHKKTYGKIISVWSAYGDIQFHHVDKFGNTFPIGVIKTYGDIINEFTVTSNDGLYSFVTYYLNNKEYHKIYINKKLAHEVEKGIVYEYVWEEVEEAYIPTVMTNCVSNGSDGTLSGDFLIGFNLLNNKYKIEITGFNETLLKKWHWAEYKLPHKVPVGATITVDIMYSDGEKEVHSLTVTKNTDKSYKGDAAHCILEEKGDKQCGIALRCGDTICLYKETNGNTENPWPQTAGITNNTLWIEEEIKAKYEGKTTDEEDLLKIKIETEICKYIVLPGINNITITAEHEKDEEANKRIFSATCATWYGGNRGLASGTRLFIGGMEGKYKNVLQWSDLSNPLYFPENCNAEVGDPSQAITGFGKQADMLVIFKPFEIHVANYLLQDAPETDEAYDFISDLTVTTAVFPLTQISSEIGCDCPGSIQLCRNRLCWVHSNGKAYTLVSSSQYNEKNIYELSDPIRRALANIPSETLKRATSTDWEGYYVLSAGEHIFLMQYESYGYSRIYSYTSEEVASHKLPWFYLVLPFVPDSVMCIENELMTVSNEGWYTLIHRADKNAVEDEIVTTATEGIFATKKVEIPSMVQSKVFDFSRPEIKKVICHILAEIGGTHGNSVKLSAITDRSRQKDFIEKAEFVSPISRYNEYSAEGKRIVTPMAEDFEKEISYINEANGMLVSEETISLDSSAPSFFRMIRVNPGIFGVRKFAVRLESEGAFSLGQVCIEYKMLGSVN